VRRKTIVAVAILCLLASAGTAYGQASRTTLVISEPFTGEFGCPTSAIVTGTMTQRVTMVTDAAGGIHGISLLTLNLSGRDESGALVRVAGQYQTETSFFSADGHTWTGHFDYSFNVVRQGAGVVSRYYLRLSFTFVDGALVHQREVEANICGGPIEKTGA
jgi:hypothetical protein